jgi:hypothetical protein
MTAAGIRVMNGKKTSKLKLNRTTLQPLNVEELARVGGAEPKQFGRSNAGNPCRPTGIDSALAC